MAQAITGKVGMSKGKRMMKKMKKIGLDPECYDLSKYLSYIRMKGRDKDVKSKRNTRRNKTKA